MDKKVNGAGIALLIIGIGLLAATLYQEEVVAEPEIPHMEIPTGKYEWRTRDMAITSVGAILIAIGVGLNLVGLRIIKRSS